MGPICMWTVHIIYFAAYVFIFLFHFFFLLLFECGFGYNRYNIGFYMIRYIEEVR